MHLSGELATITLITIGSYSQIHLYAITHFGCCSLSEVNDGRVFSSDIDIGSTSDQPMRTKHSSLLSHVLVYNPTLTSLAERVANRIQMLPYPSLIE